MAKKDNYTPLGQRLDDLIKFLKEAGVVNDEGKMNNEVFATSIGIDPGQLSAVKSGRGNLTLPQLIEINTKYAVRTGWLLEGELPMFTYEKSGTEEAPDSIKQSQIIDEVGKMAVSLQRLTSLIGKPMVLQTALGAPGAVLARDKRSHADKQLDTSS